jgi:Flp pilus assembly protein TadG
MAWGLASFLEAFRRDRRGVSAIEFGFIAPVILTIYMGLAELSEGLTAQRRVSHVSSALGDLVAQSDVVTVASLTDILSGSATMLTPYSTTGLKMRVTSVTVVNGTPTVQWSYAPTGQASLKALKKGDAAPACSATKTDGCVPSGLLSANGENTILSEAQYTYSPLLKWVIKADLNLNEKSYLRARKSGEIACTDCPTS